MFLDDFFNIMMGLEKKNFTSSLNEILKSLFLCYPPLIIIKKSDEKRLNRKFKFQFEEIIFLKLR